MQQASNWPLDQTNIDTAFLWADIDEDIYMQQPEGHIDPDFPEYVCKLLKSLYDLKQAAHLWNQLLSIEETWIQATSHRHILFCSH